MQLQCFFAVGKCVAGFFAQCGQTTFGFDGRRQPMVGMELTNELFENHAARLFYENIKTEEVML